jgi:5-methylcytosine-specific restriction enzyme B
MTHADGVRDYVFEHYIRPARERGEKSVVFRVGDVHSALRYTNRLPLVCAALGAMKFRDKHRLTLLKTDGPMQSTTTTFTSGLREKRRRGFAAGIGTACLWRIR